MTEKSPAGCNLKGDISHLVDMTKQAETICADVGLVPKGCLRHDQHLHALKLVGDNTNKG